MVTLMEGEASKNHRKSDRQAQGRRGAHDGKGMLAGGSRWRLVLEPIAATRQNTREFQTFLVEVDDAVEQGAAQTLGRPRFPARCLRLGDSTEGDKIPRFGRRRFG